MPVTYNNRKNKTYYLHEGKTKTGKTRYYLSMKTNGQLVDEIPDGYEIYEHPSNAQVFLRKKTAAIDNRFGGACREKIPEKTENKQAIKHLGKESFFDLV